MSTSTELRRIVGAMTERPWRVHRCGSEESHEACGIVSADHDEGYADIVGDMAYDECHHPASAFDMTAAVTLANHADALVALVEACERLHDEQSQPAVYAVMRALDAVHAVKIT